MPRVSFSDAEVHFSDEGRGTAVLLLHGFPSTHLLWKEVAPRLATAGFRTIAPDLVGYGDSRCDEGTAIDAASQARWQLALLESLALEERPVLVAHDIGTAVAQLMVARAPDRFDRLILIDGVYADRWAMEAVESIRDWDLDRAASLAKVLGRRARAWTKSAASAQAIGNMLGAFEGESGGWSLIRAARSLDPTQTLAIIEQLRRDCPPSLILWGEDDKFLSAEEVGHPLAELLRAQFRMLPGGHFLPLDSPEVVSAEIQRFSSSRP
jgi:pimeloyl-ACP methyl ester carboxylesterase